LDQVQDICDHNFKYAHDLEFVPKATIYFKIQDTIKNLNLN